MLLSFAAYQQTLDDSWAVGTVVRADLHRYPGGSLRALTGVRHAEALPVQRVAGLTIADACTEVGDRVAVEPWIERMAVTVTAAPTFAGGRWVLTDATGALPLLAGPIALGTVLAAGDGAPVTTTVEWTPRGLVPAHRAPRRPRARRRPTCRPDVRRCGMSAAATTVEELWRELVTAALLGTDRREPPVPPIDAIADVVADAVRPDAASRMLATVGAVAAARRAGVRARAAGRPAAGPGGGRRPADHARVGVRDLAADRR